MKPKNYTTLENENNYEKNLQILRFVLMSFSLREDTHKKKWFL